MRPGPIRGTLHPKLMVDRRCSGEKSLVRPSLLFLLAALAVVAAACGGASHRADPPRAHPPANPPRRVEARAKPTGLFAHPLGPSHLAPGSDPSVLPGDVLIADRSNNRLLVVDPEGRIVWRFPRLGGGGLPLPDDAFFSPDGRQIVVTEEDVDAVSVVDIASQRIVWRYGELGVPGSSPNRLAHPDDAMMLPDGSIVAADIENCRLVELRPHVGHTIRTSGSPVQGCLHSPPSAWGSPNGAFPLAGGGTLVTEINGDWVDALSPSGRLLWSTHPPGVYYPSDSNEVRPGLYVTVGWQSPGVLETFDRQGGLKWRYRPRAGAPALDHPSLALPLPNGDFLVNDDFNDRVIVIDPRTNRIVWQYGHTGVPGRAPGYLSRPDGLDLAPPAALLTRVHARIRLPR
jgi:outer membrane protein assembly factor BamB